MLKVCIQRHPPAHIIALIVIMASGCPRPQPDLRPELRSVGKMVFVRDGSFVQGADGCRDVACDSSPARTVTLRAYYIEAFEVSVREYRRCVESGVCDSYHVTGVECPVAFDMKGLGVHRVLPFSEQGECNWARPQHDDHPMNCISWWQAKRYCEWTGKRLPTESEWERVARGDRGGPDDKNLRGCSRVNRLASSPSTVPVGGVHIPDSPHGAYQMLGNVSEWVADWYGRYYYQAGDLIDPRGAAIGKSRVLRGGNYQTRAEIILEQATARSTLEPSCRMYWLGFRCAGAGR